jgi:hypothetical protein
MAISNERFKTLFLNWWEMYEKELTLSDMEDLCKDIGMTRGEFIELVSQSNEFITKSGWTPPESEAAEKVNTETGEGVFWKEYTEEEDVNIGDTDQAILETALTQIGIPYSWEGSCDGDGGWIDLKIVDGGKTTNRTAAEIYFTKERAYIGTN